MSNSVQQEFTEFVFSIEAKDREIPDRALAKKAISLLDGLIDNPSRTLHDKTVRDLHYEYFHVEENMVYAAATRLSLFSFSYLLSDNFSKQSIKDVQAIFERMTKEREVDLDHLPEATQIVNFVRELFRGVTTGILVGLYATPSGALRQDILRSCHIICSELWNGLGKLPYIDLMADRIEVHVYHEAEIQTQDILIEVPRVVVDNLLENDVTNHYGALVKAFIDTWSEHMAQNLETIPELMVEQGLRYFFPEESERAKAEHLMHLGSSNLEQLQAEPSDNDDSPVNNFLI